MVRDTPMVHNERTKRKSKNVDSRLKISGMTKKGSFLNGSTRGPQYLKAFGFPPPRHPGNLQAGVHKYLKTKEKAKTWIPD